VIEAFLREDAYGRQTLRRSFGRSTTCPGSDADPMDDEIDEVEIEAMEAQAERDRQDDTDE
jgi:hypothetical protein